MSEGWKPREALALIGDKDVGKTSFLILFSKAFRIMGEVEGGKLGGNISGSTDTLDFLNFAYNGRIYTLYGTGGDRTRITDYYRKKVVSTASKFILVIDATRSIREQTQFLKDIGFVGRRVVLCINKVDLVDKDKISQIKDEIISELERINIAPTKIFETVALEKKGFEQENKNIVNAVLEYIK